MLGMGSCEQEKGGSSNPREEKVEFLLSQMTIEEKVGQLNFQVGDLFHTGPTVRTSNSDKFDEGIRKGEITGLFNIHGAAYTRRLQDIAVKESRLGIPLIFGADVIHGFKTVFPIPLASAASWDLEAIEQAERVAAIESTAAGINLNFAPMVDIARDARWGRVAESAGEDPYLGSQVAIARVKGFQGNDLSDTTTLAACIKHFAAYGAPEGGREYNTVDMSERRLRETYLPPYKAGIDAGAATVMTSFNELNGIPVSGNFFLMREILRGEWGFKGAVVSDWQSISEMVVHGNVANDAEAASLALRAGVDLDMMADGYIDHIPALVAAGELDVSYVDEAVRNVLRLKYDLGLFEDPYRYCDTVREQTEIRSDQHLAIARDVARKSIVLLQNEDDLLPLAKDYKSIAVIGPLADNQADMNGSWSFFGEAQHPVTFIEGVQEAVGPTTQILHAQGANLYDNEEDLMEEAVALAKQAEVALLFVGEPAIMNGEAASRSNIKLPGVQEKLVEEVAKTGTPIVLVVQCGRALDLSAFREKVSAIVVVWTLGSEAGHAAADVLFGDHNPSGKLPVSFPRSVGQVPLYYSQKQTGRPYDGDYNEAKTTRVYLSKYYDIENTPLWPFGYGLSYSNFEYSDIRLSAHEMSPGEKISASVEVTNTSDRDGVEVVQMYIRDYVGSVTRPVSELKGFQKVLLKAGETKEIRFEVGEEDLAFYRADMSFGAEPGLFRVMIGTSSSDYKAAEFSLSKE